MFYDKASPSAPYAPLKRAVNETIARLIGAVEPATLRHALVHGTAGGKRVRPMLTMLSCSAAGGNALDALHAATAIELLHTSSLVHDDIMDDADMRRGVPTIHSRFGNSMGILAGDTLIALAFQLIQSCSASNKEGVSARFTRAFLHTCEGQGFDLALADGSRTSPEAHRLMVEKKTARLMEAATAIGGMIGTSNEDYVRALGQFGFSLGMAFQAKDDLLDHTGEEKILGKPVQADRRNGKLTYLSLAGNDRAGQGQVVAAVADKVEELTRAACSALYVLPPTSDRENLKALAYALLDRQQ